MVKTKSEYRFVVYNLICPITNKVRYVGKSANYLQRYKEHCQDVGTETIKKIWITFLKSKRMLPILQIVSKHKTEQEGRIAENENCIKNIATVFNIFMPGKNTPTVADYRKMNNIVFDDGGIQQPENKQVDKYNKL